MTARARRAWLLLLFFAALAFGALLEYVLPVADGLASGLTREAATRMSYAAAAAALVGLAVVPLRPATPTRLAWLALAAAMAVAINNFPIATLLIHRTATVTAGAEAIFAFLLSCLATALFEELLFRAFLLPLCLARLGTDRRGGFAAVLLSSAIFGAMHLFNLAGGNVGGVLLQVGYSFLIGCVAATLCCLFGRLLPAVIFHATYNACGYFVPTLGTGPLYDTPTVVVTVLLSLACAAAVFFALWQKFSPTLRHTGAENAQKSKKI